MSAIWRAFGRLLGGILCILLLAALIVLFIRKGVDPAIEAKIRRGQMTELELNRTLVEKRELLQLRTQIEEVKASLASNPKNRNSTALAEKVESALEKLSSALTKNDTMLNHLEQEDYVATTGSQLAAQNLSAAQVVIGGLSVAFAVVLFGATILTALNLHSYKEEADKKAIALQTVFDKLKNQGEALLRSGQATARATGNAVTAAAESAFKILSQSETRIGDLTENLEQLQRKLAQSLEEQSKAERRTREYLIKIADVHGSAFSELLGAVPRDPAYSEAVERLLNKGLELQARMDLSHPEKERYWDAIARLATRGTKVAIPDLIRLRDDERIEKSLALHADRAIQEIQKRYPPAEGRAS